MFLKIVGRTECCVAVGITIKMNRRLAELTTRFGANLKPHDKEQFEFTTFEDMEMYLNTVQSKQDQTKTMMNMKRLELFRDGMQELDSVFSTLDSSDGRHAMKYVWGSIKFLVTVRLLCCCRPYLLCEN